MIVVVENIEKLTFADINSFWEEYIRGIACTFYLLGDEKDLDFSYLEKKSSETNIKRIVRLLILLQFISM
jgi:hypothetical protein